MREVKHRFLFPPRASSLLRAFALPLCFACTVLAQTTQSAADPAFLAKLEAIDAKVAKVEDLVADFQQIKFSALMKEPLRTTGTIHAKGSTALWRSEKPEPSRMRVTTERLQIYYPRQKTVEDYPIAGKLGELAASPLPKLSTLRERFTIAPDPPGAGDDLPLADVVDSIALRLEPKEADFKQYVDHVRVRLDASRGLLVAFEVTDPDGERTVITFSNIKTNTHLSDSELELKPDRGTRVVKPLEP